MGWAPLHGSESRVSARGYHTFFIDKRKDPIIIKKISPFRAPRFCTAASPPVGGAPDHHRLQDEGDPEPMHFHIPYHSNLERYPTKLLALYHALRDSIVEGVLERGTRLPSTRELASAYGLSRGTVNQVYEMLAAEGYVDCRTGSGTYVAFRRSTRTSGAGAAAARPEEAPAYPLSPWSRRLGPPPGEPVHGGGEAPSSRPGSGAFIDFHYFAPDLSGFPREEWNRCLHAAVRGEPAARLMDEPAQGWEPLREAIAQYLRRARGLAAEPGQIAITGGSVQAIALLAQLLIGPGEAAVVETPSYGGFRRAVRAAGGRCIDAPIDGEGIIPAAWDCAGAVRDADTAVPDRSGALAWSGGSGCSSGPTRRALSSSRTIMTASSATVGKEPSNRCACSAARSGSSTSDRSRSRCSRPRGSGTRCCLRPWSSRSPARRRSSSRSRSIYSSRRRWPPSWPAARTSGTCAG
ncbi:PLP-dependent aminotransferase family protein [Paenibacillus mucilaginosus]|uniref:aminotransferase-like domain-containing protein n=1 Tax=Paenibacillus mucilaginosus TaxID=61624 RepID=UPI001EE65CBD|nr:PLP-dependent aminotransferase family protein [Paenibacillus mucilaginosus]